MNTLKRKDIVHVADENLDIARDLQNYYNTIFPFELIFKWLSCGDFSRREMSYTTQEGQNEIYNRYKSWTDVEHFASEIRLACPIRIDIGATYPCPPAERAEIGNLFKPQTRELVFDVDMTDYDDVRSCCRETDMCHLCWPLMVAAIKITDFLLRQCFGFTQLLWIYSGRRGVHCWVSDASARLLSAVQRSVAIDYLISLRDKPSPWTKEICEMVEPIFKTFVQQQGIQNPKPMLSYVYPRFDISVTKGMGHLLKCPFAIHPKTGRVCVPIDPKRCEEFDPFASPTVDASAERLATYMEMFSSLVNDTL